MAMESHLDREKVDWTTLDFAREKLDLCTNHTGRVSDSFNSN